MLASIAPTTHTLIRSPWCKGAPPPTPKQRRREEKQQPVRNFQGHFSRSRANFFPFYGNDDGDCELPFPGLLGLEHAAGIR